MKLKVMGAVVLLAIGVLSACVEGSAAVPTPIPTPMPTSIPTPTAVPTPIPTAVPTAVPIPTPTIEVPIDTCVAPDNGAAVCVNPGQTSVDRGGLGQFSINVKPGEHGISGVELVISFDPTEIRVIATEPGELLGVDPIVGVEKIDQSAGKIWVAWARVGPTDSPSTGGSVASVSFQVHETVELTSTLALTLTTVNLVDELFAEIPLLHLEDGEILVGDS